MDIDIQLMQKIIQSMQESLIKEIQRGDVSFEGLANKTGVHIDDIKTIIKRRANPVRIQSLLRLVIYYAGPWNKFSCELLSWQEYTGRKNIVVVNYLEGGLLSLCQ